MPLPRLRILLDRGTLLRRWINIERRLAKPDRLRLIRLNALLLRNQLELMAITRATSMPALAVAHRRPARV